MFYLHSRNGEFHIAHWSDEDSRTILSGPRKSFRHLGLSERRALYKVQLAYNRQRVLPKFLARRGKDADVEWTEKVTSNSLMRVSHFRSTVNLVTRMLLILVIFRYAVYGMVLGFEWRQRGTEGVLSKLEHLTHMLTWRTGVLPTTWVEGAFALGTSVLLLIYLKTRKKH